MGKPSGPALAGGYGSVDLYPDRLELVSISRCAADRVALVSIPGVSLVLCGCCARSQPGVGLASRCEYLLATWSARVVLVLSVYLVVIIPAIVMIALARRPVPEDIVTVYGIISALGVVGLVLTFLVSLGFLMGTLLRKPLLAVVVLIFVWYPIGLILSVFSLEQFSPISLSRALSTQLRQPWRQTGADAKPKANMQDMQAFARQVDHFFSVLSSSPPKPKTTKAEFFEAEEFEDFSMLRVILGYGLPTLIAVILATLSFYWRDL